MIERENDRSVLLLFSIILTVIFWFLFVVYLDNLEQKKNTKQYKHELLPGQVPVRRDSIKGTTT